MLENFNIKNDSNVLKLTGILSQYQSHLEFVRELNSTTLNSVDPED